MHIETNIGGAREISHWKQPCECDYCIESFTVKIKVERPKSSHTGEKPYQCQYCKKKKKIIRAYSHMTWKSLCIRETSYMFSLQEHIPINKVLRLHRKIYVQPGSVKWKFWRRIFGRGSPCKVTRWGIYIWKSSVIPYHATFCLWKCVTKLKT